MSDLFARVRPLVGEALDSCQVAVVGSPAAGVLVEYLVACGVRRWLVLADNGWMGALLAKLRERYGDELDITLSSVASVAELGRADLALVVDDAPMACRLPVTVPRLAIFTPTNTQPSHALLSLAGETFGLPEPAGNPSYCGWDWLTAAPLMALAARALLLRGTAYAMATWEDAWARGQRAYTVGALHDPTQARWQVNDGHRGDRTNRLPHAAYAPGNALDCRAGQFGQCGGAATCAVGRAFGVG